MSQHKHSEKVLEDLENAIEHLKLVKLMVHNNQSCANILNQISGVFVRLNSTRSLIVNDHVKSCITGIENKNLGILQSEIESILKAALSNPPTGSFH